ncbi:hypothetical protein [Escherichia coli]|uniref:hypothetical protein n=1 Tax=Escherichia coli TaxID=562 RepID=UPI0012FFA08C|nr:hypothetical protein [Escherichia coli]
MLSILMGDQYLLFAAIFKGEGGDQISATQAAQYRRLTFPRIAAGSKTFFWNIIK